MGKGRTRRSGKGRKAYLKWKQNNRRDDAPKHRPVIFQRNGRSINIAAVARDPASGRLVDVEYNATQLHGKRGLTMARATGPTAVAIQTVNDCPIPSMVPRAEAQAKRLAMEAKMSSPATPLKSRMTVAGEEWQSLRRSGFTEYHRIVINDIKDDNKRTWYSLELFFSGRSFFFFEENLRSRAQSCSIEYHSHKSAMWAHDNNRIRWKESVTLPPEPPPTG